MNIENLVWTEKYRPKTLEDLVITPEDKSKLESYIKTPSSMPNILLVGVPGTGKTTTAKIIPLLIKCKNGEVLTMNASDDRKIDAIRNKIVPFITAKRRSQKIPKIIHMDEFDGTNSIFQDALRPYMEGRYNDNVKFILTANRINDIAPAIQERCIIFDFASVSKDLLCHRMKVIADLENITTTTEGLKKLVDINYPSRRRMVSTLQKLKDIGITEESVKTDDEMNMDLYNILVDTSIEKRAYKVREFIIKNNIDCRKALKDITIYATFEDKKTQFKPTFKYELSQMAGTIELSMALAADKEIEIWKFICWFINNM